MEANRDYKKEPKQRKNEAEDAQDGHQVGSLNGKALLGKAACLGKIFIYPPMYHYCHSSFIGMSSSVNPAFVGPRI